MVINIKTLTNSAKTHGKDFALVFLSRKQKPQLRQDKPIHPLQQTFSLGQFG